MAIGKFGKCSFVGVKLFVAGQIFALAVKGNDRIAARYMLACYNEGVLA